MQRLGGASLSEEQRQAMLAATASPSPQSSEFPNLNPLGFADLSLQDEPGGAEQPRVPSNTSMSASGSGEAMNE